MQTRTFLTAMALSVSSVALGAVPAQANQAPAAAPPSCRVFNPLFEWRDGQERALKAADKPCDTLPGKRAWLIFQSNGNLAFYVDGKQVWDSTTKGRGNRLVERDNGALDLVDPNDQVLWATYAPGASGYQPHPNGGFGIGFTSESDTDTVTEWTEDEGLCGPGGACGETLWGSRKGLT